ncbi:hypothetical protein [Paraglaciecola sp. L3A3]|uniref:hypothetical protein n=1 Tax=Paraglaciecola sp. L3A3 TaxID=2686358 RepID=UPI00131B3C38|nr:hypothetical protein [Paraglaciecola sp. L3A3]
MLIVPSAYAIDTDKLVVVIDASSKVSSINKYELIGIYMGKYRADDSNITITPVDNGQYTEHFYQMIIGKSVAQVNSYWARLKFTGRDYQQPIKKSDTSQTLTQVTTLLNSISYIKQSELTSDVKVIYEID